ncbi:12644_t:CDS:2 [Rhizophagus irregularis]|nr:12644_t:CDS:2 [Rhizophagus irregularis]
MAPKTFDDSALQPQPQQRPLINNISRNSARHYQSPSTISLPPIYNQDIVSFLLHIKTTCPIIFLLMINVFKILPLQDVLLRDILSLQIILILYTSSSHSSLTTTNNNNNDNRYNSSSRSSLITTNNNNNDNRYTYNRPVIPSSTTTLTVTRPISSSTSIDLYLLNFFISISKYINTEYFLRVWSKSDKCCAILRVPILKRTFGAFKPTKDLAKESVAEMAIEEFIKQQPDVACAVARSHGIINGSQIENNNIIEINAKEWLSKTIAELITLTSIKKINESNPSSEEDLDDSTEKSTPQSINSKDLDDSTNKCTSQSITSKGLDDSTNKCTSQSITSKGLDDSKDKSTPQSINSKGLDDFTNKCTSQSITPKGLDDSTNKSTSQSTNSNEEKNLDVKDSNIEALDDNIKTQDREMMGEVTASNK